MFFSDFPSCHPEQFVRQFDPTATAVAQVANQLTCSCKAQQNVLRGQKVGSDWRFDLRLHKPTIILWNKF